MSEKPWRFLHSNEQLSDRDVAGGAREDSCELQARPAFGGAL